MVSPSAAEERAGIEAVRARLRDESRSSRQRLTVVGSARAPAAALLPSIPSLPAESTTTATARELRMHEPGHRPEQTAGCGRRCQSRSCRRYRSVERPQLRREFARSNGRTTRCGGKAYGDLSTRRAGTSADAACAVPQSAADEISRGLLIGPVIAGVVDDDAIAERMGACPCRVDKVMVGEQRIQREAFRRRK